MGSERHFSFEPLAGERVGCFIMRLLVKQLFLSIEKQHEY
jgi:hypothetical protein